MKTNSRIIAVVLAAAVLVCSVAMLAGCNGDNKTEPTGATTATAAATTPAEDATQAAQDATQAQPAETQANAGGDTQFDEDGYISQSVAVANVRQLAGSGAEILSVEKGYSPEGIKCWVITVAPVTTSGGPETVVYYSGYQFCYPESTDSGESDTDDNYIDEAEAIANVRQLAGSGAQIISCEKGFSPEGFHAWVITVAPVTTSDGAQTVVYYSGYQFCYAEGQE